MAIQILAAADLHLGRRSKKLPRGADPAVSSPIQTWHRIVDEAVQRRVDLVCLAGDLVDKDNKYFEAFGPLMEGFRKLETHQIPVYLIAGNHDFDVLPELVEQAGNPYVHLLGASGEWEHETIDGLELPLTIAGWSFPAQHCRTNPLKNLPVDLPAGTLTVGLLHGDVDAADSRYAPVRRSDLEAAPVDLWLLGHIHKPELLSESPMTFYPGSPHALDSGEKGKHGVWLVTIHSENRIERSMLPLSPIRYEQFQVGMDEITSREEWRAAVVSAVDEYLGAPQAGLQQTKLLMCDIELTGRSPAYEAINEWTADPDIQEFSYVQNGTEACLRKIRNAAKPAVGNLEELAEEPTPAGYLAHLIQTIEQEQESDLLEELLEKLRPVFQRLDTSAVFSPLRGVSSLERNDQAIADHLLERSYELLYTLIEQKDHAG